MPPRKLTFEAATYAPRQLTEARQLMPPWDHHRAPGIALLQDPRGGGGFFWGRYPFCKLAETPHIVTYLPYALRPQPSPATDADAWNPPPESRGCLPSGRRCSQEVTTYKRKLFRARPLLSQEGTEHLARVYLRTLKYAR